MTPGDQPIRRDAAATLPGTAYRPELQGLRALAVVLVVGYHVWINRVSGGVDVFFVVSGFLLTGQLVRAAERGTLNVAQRWSRTLMRLTPAVTVVLVATATAGMLVLPQGRWAQTVREIAAAALYLENWQLAADAVDYSARNNMASVVQHFWSLSIQGQFFLLWPLLIAVVALASRHALQLVRRRATLLLLGVFVASLAYSVELTILNQPLAYFHTLTRLWEFAAGGLLALHADRVVLTLRARIVAGWVGVLGLGACGMALPVASAFPGFAALWPTGCAALVLLAGQTGSRAGVDRLLAARPVRYLGDISFTLYLWHWPVLVLYLVSRDRETVPLADGAAIIAGSLVLAVLTHHLVERPAVRRPATPRTAYSLAAAATAAVLLLAATWQFVGPQQEETAAELGDAAHPGAMALLTGAVDSAPLLPSAVSVYEDWVRIEHWDCTPMAAFAMDACAQPMQNPVDGDGVAAPPARRVVVVGDSHAQQLTGALLPIARQNNWQVIAIIRGACPFSTASEVVTDEPDCLAWNAAAADEISTLRPDAVITLASRDVRPGLTEQTPPGFVDQWRRLDEQGIPVLALRDNPRFGYSIPDCVQNQPEDIDSCGVDRTEVYAPTPPWTDLPDVPGNVSFIDTADAVCAPDRCSAVVGNVLVYLDDNHLSATYSTSMSELLASQIHTALGW